MTLATQPTTEAASRKELSRAMADIHRRGWCDGTGGNFSCVLQRQPLQLLMAPSGVAKGSVAAEQLIVVNDQAQVERGEGRASAETLLHLAIVEATDAGAVLHTHSQAGTLLSQRVGRHGAAELVLQDLEMLKGLDGITTHATAVAVPVLPNDQDLVRLSAAAQPLLRSAPHGLLIAGHGLYAWGKDLAAAQRHLEILEFLLEQRWRELLLDPTDLSPRQIAGVSHVLLDIEGTTCPVSFVAEVLFPYAAGQLPVFLEAEQQRPDVQELIEQVKRSWQLDAEATEAGIPWEESSSVVPYLQWLIRQDRKVTALKDLQGLIWQQGYAHGKLHGPLFVDVAPALRRWSLQGLQLAVYSSGSIQAQQLLYGNSNAGDLRPLFRGWYDTRSGNKLESRSYQTIAADLGVAAERILFISDAIGELEAAHQAGMQVLFSDREGNPSRDAGPFERITSFSTLQIHP